MAAQQFKRPRAQGSTGSQNGKRRKLTLPTNGGRGSNPTYDATSKQNAPPEDLAWRSVSLPDRLDDYEGFFGLEEVDDVEVVQDAASGKVKYLPKADQPPLTENADNIKHIVRKQNTKVDVAENGEPEEEWSGFGDDQGKVTNLSLARSKSEGHDGEKPLKSSKRKSHRPAQGKGTVFDALDEAGDINGVSVEAWKSLNLSPDTLASLSRLGFSHPTPIQRLAIQEILAGHDVIGKASTGSGKTLAFGIPILERFLELRSIRQPSTAPKTSSAPLALILSPTRELAHQLNGHLAALCLSRVFDGPKIATLTGGLSVQKQQRLLKSADIIIGTPGRLWELMSSERGAIQALRQIHFLVLDEADRLLSEGHFKEVEEILTALDREDEKNAETDQLPKSEETSKSPNSGRQTLVFSATLDRGLQKRLSVKDKPSGNVLNTKESLDYLLARLNFREAKPKLLDVNPANQLATGLKEGLIECGGTEKDLYLYMLLLTHSTSRVLVFTNSIDAVRRLSPFLQNLGLPALALHSGMPQKARLRSIERFTQSKESAQSDSAVLVATDVAARGLDIPNVQLVIHYHLPRAADTYVHRSGRTARAGQPGSSLLLCAPDEVVGVRRLVAKVHAQSAKPNGLSALEGAKQGIYIRTIELDRRTVSRLKPRATLAKKLADTMIAKGKQHTQDDLMRSAAEELGVDYDSEVLNRGAGRQGRGNGRKKREREARSLSKAEAGAMRAELRELLKERVNVGVSERYLTSGGVDVDDLLRQQEFGNGKTGEFIGSFSLEEL